MTRISRKYFLVNNGFYHITARGNNKKIIFREDSDYQQWKTLLARYKTRNNSKVIAYCLMPNHYHLLLKSGPQLPRLMACLNTQYAKYYNKKYTLKNHLFGDRYSSFIVDDDLYLIDAIRYIHNNPVEAKLVLEAYSFPYSSLTDYINGSGLTDIELINDLIDLISPKTSLVNILTNFLYCFFIVNH